MKQSRMTLFILLILFVGMIGLLIMQSAQRETLEIPPTHENLMDNDVNLEVELLFPSLIAEDVRAINILDPFLKSEVTVVRADDESWQVLSEDDRPTNQDYAESLAVTLEKIPYIAQINANGEIPESYGLNERDGLILVSAVLSDEQIKTFLVGNPVTTNNDTRGFYTLVEGRDTVYVVPPEPVMYLVRYLEAFENTQKLDK